MSAPAVGSIPPGPKGLPIIGSAFDLRRDPLGFLTMLARDFGDVALFRLGSRRIYQLNHPDYVREVLVTNNRAFVKTGLVLQARPILGRGLLTSEGDFHRRQRRLMQPALHPQRISGYGPVITEFAARLNETWQDGQSVDMFKEMLCVTLKIVARALFNTDVEREATGIEEALTIAIEHFNRLLSPRAGLRSRIPTPGNLRYKRAEQFLDQFVYRLIAERRAKPADHGDVLSMLLVAQDHEGDGSRMDDRQVRDEVMTLLAAGHETLATAMTWTWYLLSQNLDCEAALHDELRSVLNGRIPTTDDIASLPYTEMVFAESMRLYPPLWALSRRAVDDCVIGEFTIPAGATVGVSQYVMQRDSRFFPDPERFDPLRWTPEEQAKRPKYSYFPFGGGPRLCIGEPFAWQEGILLLATFAQRWRAELRPGHTVELHPLITLRPRGGLPMILRRRSGADAANREKVAVAT